jgi:hypothetical protein
MHRGRAPTVSRAADCVACPFVLDDDVGRISLDLGVAKVVIACG